VVAVKELKAPVSTGGDKLESGYSVDSSNAMYGGRDV
jgi:hypothetical protein